MVIGVGENVEGGGVLIYIGGEKVLEGLVLVMMKKGI